MFWRLYNEETNAASVCGCSGYSTCDFDPALACRRGLKSAMALHRILMQNLSSTKQANDCNSGVAEAVPVQLTYEAR